MFGTKCAKKVLAELAAAANTTTETPAAVMCEACGKVDVSQLPSSRICEGCSESLMQCQRCRHKLGKHRVSVATPEPRTTTVAKKPAQPLPPNPLVKVFKPERVASGGGSKGGGGDPGEGGGSKGGGGSSEGGGGSSEGGGGSSEGGGKKEVVPPTREEIADRAYFIWVASGWSHGHHDADWLEAERQLWAERIANS